MQSDRKSILVSGLSACCYDFHFFKICRVAEFQKVVASLISSISISVSGLPTHPKHHHPLPYLSRKNQTAAKLTMLTISSQMSKVIFNILYTFVMFSVKIFHKKKVFIEDFWGVAKAYLGPSPLMTIGRHRSLLPSSKKHKITNK